MKKLQNGYKIKEIVTKCNKIDPSNFHENHENLKVEKLNKILILSKGIFKWIKSLFM